MMEGLLSFSFAAPFALAGLLALPLIWLLLRVTPPSPKDTVFPPLQILLKAKQKQETAAHTPWWILLIRLLMVTCLILAASGPIWQPIPNTLRDNAGPVILVIDNGWSAAPDWQQRIKEAERVIDEAEQEGRTLILLPTAFSNAPALNATDATTAKQRLRTMQPQPYTADLSRLSDLLANTSINDATAIFLSDPVSHDSEQKFLETLSGLTGENIDTVLDTETRLATIFAQSEARDLNITIKRLNSRISEDMTLRAIDQQSRPVADTIVSFSMGSTTANASFDIPLELRNDIASIELLGSDHVGGIQLLDDRFRRKRIGVVSGRNRERAQPLLSGSNYVTRALDPFAEVELLESGDVNSDIQQLVENRAAVIILTDIGTLPAITQQSLEGWIEEGGILVRFAGPALATSEDTLLPVPIRRGGRTLGGTLSWETPQKIGPFPATSPFAGLTLRDDITIERQILAEPGPTLADNTWAELEDGTPLVTAAKQDQGLIVLFHVTADTRWSNLALSVLFEDMMRKIASLGTLTAISDTNANTETADVTLSPVRVLDGFANWQSPGPDVRPITLSAIETGPSSTVHPPGLYGPADSPRSLNFIGANSDYEARSAESLGPLASLRSYPETTPLDLRPWLFGAAALLALLDTIIMLFTSGLLSGPARRASSALGFVAMLGLSASLVMVPKNTAAQSFSDLTQDEIDFAIEATRETRLAYVLTGNAQVDETSRQGMEGLSRILTQRTAFEPGKPMGVDPRRHELSFFPLLYWPVTASGNNADDILKSRIDAYMRNGGTILFDTRDRLSTGFGSGSTTAETQALRALLADLDIPPLEPVPDNHVLTKSFYLMETFPGRYANGQLWVEALPLQSEDANAVVRTGDGVSPILITSNDMAAAWAMLEDGRPVYPTIPPDPFQREWAYRAGVNIAMYVLTGNYKADQVHVPALLERLGQ
jgi:hypothetical protein